VSTEAFRFRGDLEHARPDIEGLSVIASDGEVGRVADVLETASGHVVLVNTGLLGFGKERMLPAGLITEIDEDAQVVRVDASSEQVKEAPKFEGDVAEQELLDHFGDADVALVGGPFASTEPDAVERHDAADEATVGTPALEPLSGASAPAATDAGPTASETESAEPDAVERQGAADEATVGTPALEPLSGASAPTATDAGPTAAETEPAESREAAATESAERPEAATTESTERPEAAATESAERPKTAVTESAEPSEPPATERVERPSPRAPRADRTPSPSRKARSGSARRDGRGSVPIPRYDALSAGDIVRKLRELSQSELTQVERYERKHDSRKTVLERIEALRGDQPWRGYDTQKVADVKKKLTKASPETARFVRDYERKHKDRSGVMQAAQRRLQD
jgi:PRC-barrel domain